jgi:methionine biosynthesis protein MetW
MKILAAAPDHEVILHWIAADASVLDLGCGDGELLELLVRHKGARVQGVEIREECILRCMARGLSVFQEDIDNGLSGYRDRSFDYVILNQSLQQVRDLDGVLREAMRVGREVIVGFPNFAHYRARLQIALSGRTPVTPALPYEWHDTPNLHFLSIADFREYCRQRRIQIRRAAGIAGSRRIVWFANLLAMKGIFLIAEPSGAATPH